MLRVESDSKSFLIHWTIQQAVKMAKNDLLLRYYNQYNNINSQDRSVGIQHFIHKILQMNFSEQLDSQAFLLIHIIHMPQRNKQMISMLCGYLYQGLNYWLLLVFELSGLSCWHTNDWLANWLGGWDYQLQMNIEHIQERRDNKC